MADEVELVIQLPQDSSVDRNVRETPPEAVASLRVAVERLPTADGHMLVPEAGEVVYSVLSPEALKREADQIKEQIRAAAADGEPLVVVVEAAEYLRDDELAGVLAAADETGRVVILRLMAGA
jgi:hypothetical protein